MAGLMSDAPLDEEGTGGGLLGAEAVHPEGMMPGYMPAERGIMQLPLVPGGRLPVTSGMMQGMAPQSSGGDLNPVQKAASLDSAFESAANNKFDTGRDLKLHLQEKVRNAASGQPEGISSAAVQYGGKTYSGATHLDATEQVPEYKADPDKFRWSQVNDGFLTNTGRFVDRKEAADIANRAGQAKAGADDGKLASEDVSSKYAGAAPDLTALTPENHDHLVPLGISDAKFALKTNPGAIGWYGRTVQKALNILSLIHPEIASDPNAALAHRYALAVTSNGNKVDKNFELADKAYQGWKATGQMPSDIGIGTAGPTINHHLATFNDLVSNLGYDGAMKFLDGKTTVAALNKQGYDVTGELAKTPVHGSAILGPKIGAGFYQNLGGNFDPLTMDRWLMRTWGRWTGNLVADRPDMMESKGAELAGHIGKLTPKQRAAFEGATGVTLDASKPVDTALAVAKASQDPDVRAAMNKVGVGGQNVRKTANMLYKYWDGQIEAPTKQQRPYIRATFAKILDGLHKQGHSDLTMADLQALLWYPEKRLYDSAKMAEGKSVAGYEEGAAPDYATAAAKMAKKMGFTDEQINAAANAPGLTHAAGLAGGAQRGSGGGAGDGLPAQAQLGSHQDMAEAAP